MCSSDLESVTFPEGVPKARKILYVNAKPSITDERIEEGLVSLEGILTVQVIYQTNDSNVPLGSFREDFPFRHSLEVDGVEQGMDSKSDILVEHINHTLLAQDEAELKVTLLCKSGIYQSVVKEVIIGAEEVEKASAKEEGIYIYYVQPGDILWSVAKKYNTTIAGILKYNSLEDENLEVGTRLLIYKKLESSVS